MNILKKLATLVALVLVGLVVIGCEKSPTVVAQPAAIKVPTPTAEQLAMKAKADVTEAAAAFAKRYDLRVYRSCDVIPPEVTALPSYREFPITSPDVYKTACRSTVNKMAADRKAVADRAVVQARERDRKVAALKRTPENAAPKAKSPVKPVAHKADQRRQ